MMKTLSMILATFFVLVVLGQEETKAQRSDYFAILPFWESPYQPFRGAYAINQEIAASRIHLQLDYDQQNRVSAAHVKLGKHYKAYEGFFGNLCINAPLTKVTYEASTEKHRFFDRLGNPIAVMGNVFTKVYEKDDHGRNVRLTFLDKQGNPTDDLFRNRSYEWIHHTDGSMVELRKNANGEITPLRGSFQFMRTRMTFGADGYFTTLQNIDEEGKLVNAPCGAATLRYFYDSQGRFSRWEVYDKDGKAAIGPSDTSGEQNIFKGYDLMDIVFFDQENEPVIHWSGAERWHFEVDKYGNRTSLTFQRNNKERMNANNGYAQIKFEWSEDGRFLLSESYYDQSGDKSAHNTLGIHLVEYKRDKKGMLTEINYFDKKGNPIARKDTGVAKVVYTYDENGVRTKSMNIDKDGKEIAAN